MYDAKNPGTRVMKKLGTRVGKRVRGKLTSRDRTWKCQAGGLRLETYFFSAQLIAQCQQTYFLSSNATMGIGNTPKQ